MDSVLGKTATLHNGITIPTIGCRLDQDNPDEIYKSTKAALNAGIRHFDLPLDANCQKAFGKAWTETGIPRYELFFSYKLANADHGYQPALRALDHSLKRTNTDYADLYLIDWPNPAAFRATYEQTLEDTWRALETTYKTGKARAIGMANFEARHIEQLLIHSEIAPMVNQARIYPGFPFTDNLNCANEHRIQTEGFLPVDFQAIINSHEIRIFAEKYNVSPKLICIRYLLEKNCIALCHSADTEEMKNLDQAFNFTIAPDDMKLLDGMKNYGPQNINPDTCDF